MERNRKRVHEKGREQGGRGRKREGGERGEGKGKGERKIEWQTLQSDIE